MTVKEQLKKIIIEGINLEEVRPEDIVDDAPLFGDGLTGRRQGEAGGEQQFVPAEEIRRHEFVGDAEDRVALGVRRVEADRGLGRTSCGGHRGHRGGQVRPGGTDAPDPRDGCRGG